MPKFRTVEKGDDISTAKRVFAIGAVFACSLGLLASRSVYFHLEDNEELEKVALRQYRTAVNQSTKRGKVLDAAGRELAIDVTVESIYANPREVDEPVRESDRLSRVLKIDRSKLFDRLSSGRKFAWVKRRVGDEEVRQVKGLNLKGMYFMRESNRSYPGGTLAATVLGAVGFDSEPLGGVELAYDDFLSASKHGPERSGAVRGGVRDLSSSGAEVRRDARGHLYLSPAGDGADAKIADIWLTIDRTLEFIAERELSKVVEKARAKGGSAVVVDVNSGAILAMANVPTFDPNNYERFGLSNWRNRSISDAYEPGSTFKTIVVAAALDAGIVSPDEIFDCENGKVRIGDKVVHDAHPHGKLSVADIIKVSSNIGAYKVEQRLGARRAYDAIRDFGFGQGRGIDLPGESAGLLSSHEKWSPLQFATIAFGQGIAATPLQMTMAFAAIANGGTLYRPYVVKRVVDKDGRDIYAGTPEAVGRPIGEATAKLMTELLVRVTEKGGTGRLAASSEYRVAGKTGTAQKADPRRGGYAKGRYYSSFVGFAPADAPRIAVYVGIDEPGGGMYYGGQLAAPVFREIVDATLHYLKVPGSLVASSGEVERQLPPKADAAELAWVESADGGPRRVVQDGDETWRLPDLKGLTMRGILKAAKGADIAWRFLGSGVAVGQSPEPGSAVPAGAECVVEFAPLM